MRKRSLYQSKHPFGEYPFEAFILGSWQAVEHIRIEDGAMAIYAAESGYVGGEKRFFQKIRLRSRQATINDCTCLLRPGIDVCVLSLSQEDEDPVWLDAKITSVERKPHKRECSCTFYVSDYVDQGCLGAEIVRISNETKAVGINQISILQKLYKQPTSGTYYRWDLSEDCFSMVKTKLTLGKFLSDMSWLLVASQMTRIPFHIRSIKSRITYQILVDDDERPDPDAMSSMNFSTDNGVSFSHIVWFNPADIMEQSRPPLCSGLAGDDGYLVDLRRSKRRNVCPERFVAGDMAATDSSNGWVRMMPYRCDKLPSEDEEEEEGEEEEEDDDDDDDDDDDYCVDDDLHVPLSSLFSLSRTQASQETPKPLPAAPRKRGRPKGSKNTKTRHMGSRKGKTQVEEIIINPAGDIKHHKFHLPIIPFKNNLEPLACVDSRAPRNHLEEIDRYSKAKGFHGKTFYDFDEVENEFKWQGPPRKGSHGRGKPDRGKYKSAAPKGGDYDEPLTLKKVSLSAGAYNKLINSYLKNIESTMTKDEHNVVDRWEELKKAANSPAQKGTVEEEESDEEGDDEESEMEIMWREMELCMASFRFLEEDEVRVANDAFRERTRGCKHDYVLNEEIGMCCRFCGDVSIEITHIAAPFMENRKWTTEERVLNEKDIRCKTGEDAEDMSIGGDRAYGDMPRPVESDNVWTLIPDLKEKLHLHQQKAFEFLWRNIAGSMEPALMEAKSENIGGCVISHTPGAGKTFLIIAFLAGYLKLFPGKRPLVLAPKTTLYTWYKEFVKWKIPLPVHLIHGRRSYRVFKQEMVQFKGLPRPSQDVMHVLDCLEKIQKWHAEPSVLVMGYTSFLTLMREDSKFSHRKYMAKVLRESPGLLVLDEGHNPRSTKSRLRKVLMKVGTDLRILLSGTLFQNNFCEYFNTLCLARPKFVHEVLDELDPKFKTKNQGKAPHLLENRARKFFLDNIARKIDSSNGEERLQGLNMLKNITNSFIDVYEAGGSDTLPGLQLYTLLMNSTDVQHKTLVKLQYIMATYHGYPLELELLITLAAIHPWLVKTTDCAKKFFNPEELVDFESLKGDARKGSKVVFVLRLVCRVVRREKLLIFCHNIAPIHLFLELFSRAFGWQRGREVLTLTGDLELFERGRVIDKFEDPAGPSRVLLASISACAEGISLTAASRVIMLDSEWNPSKTKQAIARAFRPGQQKVVYVYQLLARGTLEEDKYRRTTWKEWVSSMIFSEEFVEDPSLWQAEKIEDDVLREIVGEDKVKSFHMIMKNEKASTG